MDRVLQDDYDSMKKVLHIMWTKPKHNRNILLFAEAQSSASSRDATEDAGSATEFPLAPRTVGDIDPVFVSGLLAAHTQMSVLEWGKVAANENKNIYRVLGMAMNCTLLAALPEECKKKEVLRRLVMKAVDNSPYDVSFLQMGGPDIKLDGKINWPGIGVFQPTYEEGILATLAQKGNAACSATVKAESIQDTFALDGNWAVSTAVFVNGSRKHSVHDLLGPDGRKKLKKPIAGKAPQFVEWVQEVSTALSDEKTKKAAEQILEDKSNFRSPLVQKKREAMNEARAALEARKRIKGKSSHAACIVPDEESDPSKP